MTTACIIGIDTGGTFTDFIVWQDGGLRTHKVLSTPAAPEQAILQGLSELDLLTVPSGLVVIHGSTVATNAVLEGKGVRTVLVTNRGMRDLLCIGRQTRRELYNLQPCPVPPPVPAEWCLETGGRLAADGSEVEPFSATDRRDLQHALQRIRPDAVAINLLFSFLDDRVERAIESLVPPGIFVARSSAVLPEYKEYERGIATWLNAYVGPLMQGYLQRLCRALPNAHVAVMQSSGGTITAAQAADRSIHLLLSGPAGGLAAARFIGELIGQPRLLTFDMGGTSTDVALIDGDLQLTNEGMIGPYPVAVPMVDLHTIGAGGGSIAYCDRGGMLQVGPQSAGAMPGPACYGHHGQHVTVTDANLILGRLPADACLGGRLRLDRHAAQQAMAKLAAQLKLSVVETAQGVVRVVNEHMAQALRVMSIQRGVDPRELVLLCFGGAGGLHVCALAEALAMRKAMVPIHAGVLSALGMIAAPRARQLSRTAVAMLAECADAHINALFAPLIEQGKAELRDEGVADAAMQVVQSLDLRYRGQSYTLNVPWQSVSSCEAAFHQWHERRYGHCLQLPVERVNVRVAVTAAATALSLPKRHASKAAPIRERRLHGIEQPVPHYERTHLAAQQCIQGPAVITETVATTFVAVNWQACCDDYGNLILTYTG